LIKNAHDKNLTPQPMKVSTTFIEKILDNTRLEAKACQKKTLFDQKVLELERLKDPKS
jgi:hypothetical protein